MRMLTELEVNHVSGGLQQGPSGGSYYYDEYGNKWWISDRVGGGGTGQAAFNYCNAGARPLPDNAKLVYNGSYTGVVDARLSAGGGMSGVAEIRGEMGGSSSNNKGYSTELTCGDVRKEPDFSNVRGGYNVDNK